MIITQVSCSINITGRVGFIVVLLEEGGGVFFFSLSRRHCFAVCSGWTAERRSGSAPTLLICSVMHHGQTAFNTWSVIQPLRHSGEVLLLRLRPRFYVKLQQQKKGDSRLRGTQHVVCRPSLTVSDFLFVCVSFCCSDKGLCLSSAVPFGGVLIS